MPDDEIDPCVYIPPLAQREHPQSVAAASEDRDRQHQPVTRVDLYAATMAILLAIVLQEPDIPIGRFVTNVGLLALFLIYAVKLGLLRSRR